MCCIIQGVPGDEGPEGPKGQTGHFGPTGKFYKRDPTQGLTFLVFLRRSTDFSINKQKIC